MAERIVSLLSSATEFVCALGLGDKLLAVSHECDFPAQVRSLPQATRSRIDSSKPSSEIDLEVRELLRRCEPLYEVDEQLLASLAPDLVITQAQCDVCAVRYEDVVDAVARTPNLVATKIVALQPLSLTDILDDAERVATAAGVPDRGQQLRFQLASRIEHVQSITNSLLPHQRPRVVCLEWFAPLMTASNWTPELLQIAGGTSLLTKAGAHSEYATWQQVVDADPDLLLLAACGFDLERTKLEARQVTSLPGYRDLKAVREGRVYAIDGNALLNRSGPRIIDTLELLAHLLHPQHFPLDPLAHYAERAWQPLEA